jgi:glyoxylase-like metal-dependent hydrolase (beta-lactamase superfamily II)
MAQKMQLRDACLAFADELSRVGVTICHGLARLGFALAALAAAASLAFAGAAGADPVRLDDGVYVLRGSGGEIDAANGGRVANIAFVVGPRGVVVVDGGVSHRHGDDIVAAVRSVTEQPIRLVILTHPGQEVVLGAASFQDRGIPVLAHRANAELIATRCDGCIARLRQTLGAEAMASTRVPVPERTIDGDETIDAIGRPLRIIAPAASSAPGAIAVLDERTSTLFTGSIVSIGRIPDLRDADVAGWRAALAAMRETRCARLIASYGPPASCDDIAAFASYFDALEARVGELLRRGVGLFEISARAQLPQFERWDQYATNHPANANRVYLRLERRQFD